MRGGNETDGAEARGFMKLFALTRTHPRRDTWRNIGSLGDLGAWRGQMKSRGGSATVGDTMYAGEPHGL